MELSRLEGMGGRERISWHRGIAEFLWKDLVEIVVELLV